MRPGHAPDVRGALALVDQSAKHTGMVVSEVLADCAYGDGRTRQALADRARTLIAKVRKRPRWSRFPQEDFVMDLEPLSCTCPAGQVTTDLRTQGHDPHGDPRQFFRFEAAVCDLCPLRTQCVSAPRGRGRIVTLHPQAALLQAARARQHSEAGMTDRRRRQAVAHRIARLVQLGLRQARYFGRQNTAFQLYMTATVANLTRILAAT